MKMINEGFIYLGVWFLIMIIGVALSIKGGNLGFCIMFLSLPITTLILMVATDGDFMSGDNGDNIISKTIVAEKVYADEFIKTISCEDVCINECGSQNIQCLKYCMRGC